MPAEDYLGKIGRITTGRRSGRYIKVVDDRAASHGYLIFSGENPEFEGTVYDDWVADEESLDAYFAHEGFEVEWL